MRSSSVVVTYNFLVINLLNQINPFFHFCSSRGLPENGTTATSPAIIALYVIVSVAVLGFIMYLAVRGTRSSSAGSQSSGAEYLNAEINPNQLRTLSNVWGSFIRSLANGRPPSVSGEEIPTRYHFYLLL